MYCVRCGSRMLAVDLEGRQRMQCPSCGYVQYENPVPGVGVLIEHGDELVLVERDRPPHVGGWALPGGFIEADERVEQAALREAREETNLDIELLELFGVYSFPEGPPRSGLIIFYRARALAIAQLRAGDDARSVKLYKADALPEICFRTHREVIARWVAMRHPSAASDEDIASHPPTGLELRLARGGDHARILELLTLIPARSGMGDGERARLAERLSYGSDLEVWVAEALLADGPCIVGFIAVSMPTTLLEPRAWVDAQVVDPSFRRRGVGRSLFEVALRRAREFGASTILVDVTRGNTGAQDFYHACGFGSAGSVEQIKIA